MVNEIDITPYTVPTVANAVLSDKKISFIYGWRDGGKSTTAFNVLLWKCLLDKHFRFAHCRAKYNEIAGSTFQTLKDCIKLMHLSDYFIIRNDRFQIISKHNPNNYFFGASADQPDKIRSTANLNGFIVDEAHDLTESDFSSLIGTLRENKSLGVPTKSIFIFNNDKVKEKSFIAKNFFDKESPMYDIVDRTLVTYLDNPFVDKEKTKEKLLQVCLGNEVKFNYLMSGAFMQELNDNPFFYAYTKKHYRPEIIPFESQFLDISFDFNKDPCTAVIGFSDPINYTFRIIDVLTANQHTQAGVSPLDALCGIIHRKYIESGIVIPNRIRVTGDASGRAGGADYILNKSFYTTIQRGLKIAPTQVYIRASNSSHLFSGEVINYFFRYCDFYHNNQFLDNEIQVAFADEKGTLNKAKEEHGLHTLDAFRYLIDFWICRINNQYTNDFKRITETIQYHVKRTAKSSQHS